MSATTTLPDLTGWTDDDLDRLRVATLTEQERRRTLATAAQAVEQINKDYVAAKEAELPPLPKGEHRPWVQPQGAHDAVPKGGIRAHNGKVWESLIPANVWAPGTDPRWWKDVTAAAPAPTPTPSAAAWDGNAKAYKVGDLVTYKGTVYKVIQAHTSQAGWTPDAVASLYTKA